MQLRDVFLALLGSLLSGSFVRASIVLDAAEIQTTSFDFIVVGGGAAGNVVANRLSENENRKVLVIEAGPSHEGVLAAEIPFLAPTLAEPSPYEWNYTTVSQTGLAGREIPFPRGHILGGSSSTNWLVYTRGSSEDFDRYAAVTGDQGWSWAEILPYFKKNEKWTAPADNHNTTGKYNPDVHGYSGPLNISLAGHSTPIDGRVLQAINELGGEYQYNIDMNSGYALGVGCVQTTVNGGSRSSSATAYLGPAYINRPNLKVLVNAQVSRLLKTDQNAYPGFRGVEFRQGPNGALIRLNATREVILSAGAIGTPHILLNSGIGDTQTLTAVGVTPLVDLPDVGQNLSDHLALASLYLVNSNDTFETLRRDPVVKAQTLTEWQNTQTGLYTNVVLSHIGFMRVPQGSVPGPDPAAGPNSPHFEMIVSNGIPPDILPPQGNFLSVTAVLVSPSSRGSITLRSNNPFDPPLIDPGYLISSFDKAAMRQGVKTVRNFVSGAPNAWAGYTLAEAFTQTSSDAELDAYIAENSGTLFHPVGTASMNQYAANGVVDTQLLVKKIKGVRVVDASVLPFVPSAHTVGPVYAIAERVADLIKAAHP